MKKALLPIIGLSALLVLGSCGGDEPAASSSVEPTPTTSSEPGEVPATGVSIIDYNTKLAIDALSFSLSDEGTIAAVVTPSEADQTVTWSVAPEGIVTVNSFGIVSPYAVGTATVTATTNAKDASGNALTDSITVTVTAPDTMAIADFAEKAQDNFVYSFSGILEGLDHSDRYGNAYISDPETGATVQLYGSTTTASVLTKDSSGTWDYNNARDAVTTLADYENGELVTGYGMWTEQYSNLSVVFTGHEESSNTYTATINTPEHGTATLSKTSGIAYGETVTVTLVPETGYDVDVFRVSTLYGTVSPTVDSTGLIYSFPATCKNDVSVSFYEVVEGETRLNIAANVDNFTSSSSYRSCSATIRGVSLSASRAAKNAPSSSPLWEEGSTLVLGVNPGASSPIDDAYLTWEMPQAASSVSFTYRNWRTDHTTVVLEYSNDGSTWTADATGEVNNTSDPGMQTYTSSTASLSATHFRIHLTSDSTYDSNRRLGIFVITVTDAA